MQMSAWSFGASERGISTLPGAVATGWAAPASMRRRQDGATPLYATEPGSDPLVDRITFEIESESAEVAEAALLQQAAEAWVKDEAWDILAENVHLADDSGTKTKGGVPHRALLMSGALQTIDRPIAQGNSAQARAALATFQMAQAAAPRCPVRAALAARANVGLAWSLRGDRAADAIPDTEWTKIRARISRATQILAGFAGNSGTLLSEARYRAAVFREDLQAALPPLYTAWTGADPLDPGPMEIHGFFLTPRWGGSFESVEVEARRAALRTDPDLGFAGYAMMTLPMFEFEPEIMAELDPTLFVEGVDDWLGSFPEPGRVNTFLRTLVDVVNSDYSDIEVTEGFTQFRTDLSEALPGLIERHLRQVVLPAWDDNPAWVRAIVARAFQEHMDDGGRIEISSEGINLITA